MVFFKVFSFFIVLLPTSKSLSLNWNFGSMLGMVYFFQVFSGFFLVFYYSNDFNFSFSSVQYLMYDVNWGWVLRIFHFNGASMFFFFIFLHFFKGLFFFSYRLFSVWFIGLLIFIFLMVIAFMGYVLVWAQMSFWACVVITSLFTIIPFFGFKFVFWIWSGFSVSGVTLKFFFCLHFFLPFFLFFFLIMHFFFLHSFGSTSKLFYCGNIFKFDFFPFYWLKDSYNIFYFFIFMVLSFFFPFFLGESEMFVDLDVLNSPVHIVPEWYFLFAYAILRSITNKFFGVIFLFLSIFMFFFFFFFFNYITPYNVSNKLFCWIFFFNSFFLSWIGQCLVEFPYLLLGQFSTFFYFFFFFFIFFNYIFSFFFFLYLL